MESYTYRAVANTQDYSHLAMYIIVHKSYNLLMTNNSRQAIYTRKDTAMKVYELIELLQDMDPDGEVMIGTQESYPFENSIVGITERRAFAMNDMLEEFEYELSDYLDERERQVQEFESDPDYGTDWNGRQLEGTHVLILEGRQLRHGSKSAWETAYA
jgi:hypothetical protein